MTGIQNILRSIGYYRLKKTIKDWIFCRRLIREDARRKQETIRAIFALNGSILQRNNDDNDIIVSLTSYGKRVTDTLPCTLYSLLMQTRRPNRIVVWLDDVNWSDEKLPDVLKKIQSLGVEFCYCKDIRSYKKLIPTLQLYPNNVIITVDDDLYYHPQTIEWFLDFYATTNKRCVIGSWATRTISNNHRYAPYFQWQAVKEPKNGEGEYILIGCGGILYAPGIFDEEIQKEELFMKYAPTADDIWFWIQEKRMNIPILVIPQASVYLHTTVNRIEDWKPAQSDSLYRINEIHNNNDKQLAALLDYYHIKPTNE